MSDDLKGKTMENEKGFANGNAILTLTQADLAAAVEFWLNEKILKVPCEVVRFEKTEAQFRTTTFEVGLREHGIPDKK